MSLHFKSEVEAALDRYSRLDPNVLNAIEANKPAFMELMSKTLSEMRGGLIQVHLVNPDQAEDHEQLQGETSDTQIDPVILENVKNLVLACYLVSFFVQEIPYLEETLQSAHENGVEDGYAYLQVKRMVRN